MGGYIIRRLLYTIPVVLGVLATTFIPPAPDPGRPRLICSISAPRIRPAPSRSSSRPRNRAPTTRCARSSISTSTSCTSSLSTSGTSCASTSASRFGPSAPINEIIGDHWPATIQLTLAGMGIALVIGIGARRDFGNSEPHVDRLRLAELRRVRRLHPELLPRRHTDHDLQRLARLAAGDLKRPRQRAHLALDHAGHGRVGDSRAFDAFLHAGRAVARLHPHGARQGPARARRHLAARAAQRADSGGHGRRAGLRRPAHGHGHHRDSVHTGRDLAFNSSPPSPSATIRSYRGW